MSRKKEKRHLSSRGRSFLQTLLPRPIRINQPIYDEELTEARSLARRLRSELPKNSPEAEKILSRQEEAIRNSEKSFQQHMRLMGEVCTALWRIDQNFSQIPPQEMPEKARRSRRHLQSIMDRLSQSGFTIKDHLHEAYDPGQLLSVAAHEHADGISRETIIETIKPSVYWQDQCIQVAEVIVGSPNAANPSD